MNVLKVPAYAVRGLLAFIDPQGDPQHGNNIDLYPTLIEKLRLAVGDSFGGQEVEIRFADNEEELLGEMKDVCQHSGEILENLWVGESHSASQYGF